MWLRQQVCRGGVQGAGSGLCVFWFGGLQTRIPFGNDREKSNSSSSSSSSSNGSGRPYGRTSKWWLRERFGYDFNVHVAGAADYVDGAEDLGLAGRQDRGAL